MCLKRPYYLLAVFLLPMLVALQNPHVKEPVRGIALSILKPVLLVGTAAADLFSHTRQGIIRFWRSFHTQALYETRIAELESEVLRLGELTKENERLRKLLEFRDTLSGKKIAARVIGWDPSPWRKTILLDKGSLNGIKKDMAVVVAEGLVGRVLEAGPVTARVILLMDTECRVSSLAEESRAQGVTAGDGSAELTLQYLELESGVAVGETILTSGLNGTYPKGIRIGKITSIAKDPTGLHLQAKVNSFVRFSKLEEVLCVGSLGGK